MTDNKTSNAAPPSDEENYIGQEQKNGPLNKAGHVITNAERGKAYLANQRAMHIHPLSLLAPVITWFSTLIAIVLLFAGLPKYISIMIILVGLAIHYACLWGVFIRFSYDEELKTEIQMTRSSAERSLRKFIEWVDKKSPHQTANSGSMGFLVAAITCVILW